MTYHRQLAVPNRDVFVAARASLCKALSMATVVACAGGAPSWCALLFSTNGAFLVRTATTDKAFPACDRRFRGIPLLPMAQEMRRVTVAAMRPFVAPSAVTSERAMFVLCDCN